MPRFQRGDGRRRAGHDAAQQGERTPVTHSLLSFSKGLPRAHDLGAKVVGLVEEVPVGAREAVIFVQRFTPGETVFSFPVLFDVAPGPLDKMPGQFDALRLGEGRHVPVAELRPQQGKKRAEGALEAAMRRGREQDNVPVLRGGDVAHELVALVLALAVFDGRRAVGLVHDDQLGTVEKERVLVAVALEEVDAGDLHRVVAVDAVRAGLAAVELADRSGADHDRFQVEFLGQFLLPLLAQIGRAQDAEPLDLAPVEQFAGDQQSFDGLAHAHIIGDEQADRVQAQRHQQGHELVDARPNRNPAKRTERRGPLAQRQAARPATADGRWRRRQTSASVGSGNVAERRRSSGNS